MSAHQKLLNWCKSQTNGYKGVNIENFHLSWRDGLAFCALVHSLSPNCGIQFDTLDPADMLGNNALAFEAGFKHLGISKLLEPHELVEGTKPEQFSVMTYLGQYFKKFGGASRPALQRTNTSPVLMSEEKQKQLDSIADVRSRFGVGKSEEGDSSGLSTNPKRKPVARTVSTSQIKSPDQMTASEKLKAQKLGEQFKKPIGGEKKPANDLVKKCYKSGVSLLNVKPVEWNGQVYHPDHFKCTTCSQPFSKNILNVGNEPFCEKCYRKALVKNKLKKQDTVSGKSESPVSEKPKDIRDVYEEQEAARLKAIAEESKVEAAKQEALREEAQNTPVTVVEQKSSIPAWRQKLLERKNEATPRSTPTATPVKGGSDDTKAVEEKAAAEKAAAEKAAAEKAAAEKAAAEKVAAEKAAAEKAAAEKAAAEKAAAEKAAAEKAAAEKAAAEKAAAEKAATEKAAAEKAAAEKAAAEKAAAEKAAAEKAAAEKAERERIAAEKERERLAAEKAAREKAAAEKAAAEKAAREKAEAERIREEELANEKIAAAKLEAERLENERLEAAARQGEDEKVILNELLQKEKKYSAELEQEIARLKSQLSSLRYESETKISDLQQENAKLQEQISSQSDAEEKRKFEKAAAEKAAAEKAATEKAAAEKAAAEKAAAEKAAAEKAAAEKAAAEKAAAEKAQNVTSTPTIQSTNSSSLATRSGSDLGERISCWSCASMNASRYKFCYNCGSPRDMPANATPTPTPTTTTTTTTTPTPITTPTPTTTPTVATPKVSSLEKQQSFQRAEKVIPEWQRKLLEKKALAAQQGK